jgi:DUF971 family protein
LTVSAPETQPVELSLKRTEHLRIRWADGEESVIPLVVLRRACPCAACQAARAERERSPLPIIQPGENQPARIVAETAELMGNYGLRIRWLDGHEAGIYDFALLRSLGERKSGA